jgi:hypothetical protein
MKSTISRAVGGVKSGVSVTIVAAAAASIIAFTLTRIGVNVTDPVVPWILALGAAGYVVAAPIVILWNKRKTATTPGAKAPPNSDDSEAPP